ncbi:hypothetical protein V6N13_096321 [Hibiscus sabdariffa]
MDQPFSLPCISLAPLDLCYMDQQILSAIAVIAMRTKLYISWRHDGISISTAASIGGGSGKGGTTGGSRESVNGGHRSMFRKVEWVVDEAKREVLKTSAIAWYRQAVLARPNLTQWFTKVEVWTSEVHVGSRSAWLSMVGIPMHLWSEETFCRIAQLWGKLIRVEDATAEPQSFKRARGVGSGGGSQTSGNCEVRGLGVVDRNARSKSEHMDVMRCVQLDMVQESPELHTAPILCEAGGESPVAMLELE